MAESREQRADRQREERADRQRERERIDSPVKAMTGTSGLYFATSLAVLPDPVTTTMSAAWILSATLTVEDAMDSSWDKNPVRFMTFPKWPLLSKICSASLAQHKTVLTDSTGKSPLSVSAPKTTPSTPSRTMFEISVASALVGLGERHIESTTRVVSTGLPAALQA